VQAIVAARDSLPVLQNKDDEKVQLFTDGKKDLGGDSSAAQEPSIYIIEQLLAIK